MFDSLENITIISAVQGLASLSKQFYNRPSHGLLLKLDGESIYTFEDSVWTVSQNDVLFIPMGRDYHVRRTSPSESRYALVNFTADIPDAVPKKIHCSSLSVMEHTVSRLTKALVFDDGVRQYACLSLFYELLSQLQKESSRQYMDSSKRRLIEPAISYLETHMFSSGLKVEELHKLCGISDTYFRQLFSLCFDSLPKQYILHKRLHQARLLLESGEFTYVYEVAAAVGFSDPLYFSKLFKKQYGHFPSVHADHP